MWNKFSILQKYLTVTGIVSACDYMKNEIVNMSIVNKQVIFFTNQYIGTCKSGYTKGYALNRVLTNYRKF